jgi:hypothetical protein
LDLQAILHQLRLTLIFTIKQCEKLLKDAYEGFEHKNRKYAGVKELIEDLKWALANNTWNISKQNYLSNGLVNIRG